MRRTVFWEVNMTYITVIIMSLYLTRHLLCWNLMDPRRQTPKEPMVRRHKERRRTRKSERNHRPRTIGDIGPEAGEKYVISISRVKEGLTLYNIAHPLNSRLSSFPDTETLTC